MNHKEIPGIPKVRTVLLKDGAVVIKNVNIIKEKSFRNVSDSRRLRIMSTGSRAKRGGRCSKSDFGAQLYEYTKKKNHLVIHFKWVDRTVCAFFLNIVLFKERKETGNVSA